MATFKIAPSEYTVIKKDGKSKRVVKKQPFDEFNENILGLGNISIVSKQTNALAVIFDLQGFTNFCRQIDPQLAVSEYLSDFLKWIFAQVRKEAINEDLEEGYNTYCDLPFMSKYLGDGILFLWDTNGMTDVQIINIVVSMHSICGTYRKSFLPRISKKVSSPPSRLRCGIARGAIYSVGNGNDFVGPCINMAARLQKLYSLSFCFSRRGFNYEVNEYMSKIIEVKKVEIRGIGSDELVCVIGAEYLALSKEEKELFTNI